MVATATYGGYIALTGFSDITGEWTGTESPTAEVIVMGDDEWDSNPSDGSPGDGVESDSELLRIQVPALSLQDLANYTGWMYNGYPIVQSSGTTFLLTNEALASIPVAGAAAYSSTYTYCFCGDTRIMTPDGERPVELLAIGDMVLTADGQSVPVKWIGRQRRHVLFARMRNELPVRVKAGALGNGCPRRDLYVSPDHALLVDGVLVSAGALVNDCSIQKLTAWPKENVEYFHIELENHELVLAEGTSAETFVDNVSRKAFDNYAEYERLYGQGSAIPELPLPRVKTRRQLSSRTRSRLREIALACVPVAA